MFCPDFTFCPLTKDLCNKDCVCYRAEQTHPHTVYDLELSVRATNCLIQCMPNCIDPIPVIEWKNITYGWLKKQPRIGKQTADEIMTAISNLQLTYEDSGWCVFANGLEYL